MYNGHIIGITYLAGVDGITSMVLVEPYSKAKGQASQSGATGEATQPEKRYNQMTADEKVKMCCRDFNKAQGCSRSAPKCR